MAYNVYDTGTSRVESCPHLEAALQKIETSLKQEEQEGRYVSQEDDNRWAVYDGFIMKMLWIENDNGNVVAYNR
ncbi:MAG: hypothetical protein QM808_16650 [Steroidobacteraceae bacterium]